MRKYRLLVPLTNSPLLSKEILSVPFVLNTKNRKRHLQTTSLETMVSKNSNATGLINPNRCSPNKYKLNHPKDHPKDRPDPEPDPNSNSDYNSPSSYKSSFSEQIIQLTDPLNCHWPRIGYVCLDSEKAFILTRIWVQYACLLDLQLMDTVRFLRPNIGFGNNHFMTQLLPRHGSEPVQIRLPAFLPHNCLFKVKFGQGDVRLRIGRLVIDAQLVKKYFPGIRKNLKQEMVKLTDYEDKDRFVKMVYSGIGDRYILMDDQWEGFVREHELEVGDRVLFFKPNIYSHDKHFLIQFVKRKKGDGLTELVKSDPVSDDDKKQTRKEQLTSQLLQVISAENLAAIQRISERDGMKSIEELMKEEQKAYQFNQQINVPLQISATRESSQKKNGLDVHKFNGSVSDSFGSDPEDEENQSLVFELEVIENDRLIIPIWMIYEDFPLLILDPDLKETLQLTDYLGHNWEVTLSYDSSLDSYVITDGWSLYIQHYHLKYMDLIRCYRHVPQHNSNHLLILHWNSIGKCLFRVVVPKSNRLRIFFNRVKGYVNLARVLAPHEHLREYIIHVTDYLDQTWEMKLVRFLEEEAYVVVQGWKQYVAKHGLRHNDRTTFCKAKHNTKDNSFLIYHELRRRPGSDSPSGNADVKFSLSIPDNIICELRLSGRLMMPPVKIPFLFLNRDIVKLADEKNKDWLMIIVKVKEGYMIIDGWEGYELEALDEARMYSPACADHHKHLLIKCEKNKMKRSEKDDLQRNGKTGEIVRLCIPSSALR